MMLDVVVVNRKVGNYHLGGADTHKKSLQFPWIYTDFCSLSSHHCTSLEYTFKDPKRRIPNKKSM